MGSRSLPENVNLLGLAGPAGVGKDFTFGWLQEYSERVCYRIAFADGVRDEVNLALGVDWAWHKPYNRLERALLQWYGTDYRRAQDEDYWVKDGLRRVNDTADNLRYVGDILIVITDVRFANEAVAIRDAGGLCLEVKAPKWIRKARLGGVLPPDHESEHINFGTSGHILNDDDGAAPLFPKERLGWLGL